MRKFAKSVAVALAAFGLAFTFSSSAHAASAPVPVCGSGLLRPVLEGIGMGDQQW
jgi:hypothetical protein